MQPVSWLEGNAQDALSRLPQPKSWTTFSLEKELACCRDSPSEKRDPGRYEWGRKDGRKTTDEKHCGQRTAIVIHQTLDTFSEVYWKMFLPPSCSIKRKKKKTCCNFLCHSTHSGKNRQDPLLHFPICSNGRLHPKQLLLTQLLRGRKQMARVRGKGPPHHPACHQPLLPLGG